MSILSRSWAGRWGYPLEVVKVSCPKRNVKPLHGAFPTFTQSPQRALRVSGCGSERTGAEDAKVIDLSDPIILVFTDRPALIRTAEDTEQLDSRNHRLPYVVGSAAGQL